MECINIEVLSLNSLADINIEMLNLSFIENSTTK